MALLPKDVHAETRLVIEGIATIAGSAGEIIMHQTPIALHESERNLLRLKWREPLDRWIDNDGLKLAEIFHLERMTNRNVEIGDAIIRLQHR